MSAKASAGMQFQIALNGVPVQGLLNASITTSNCFSSDSYALTFAMGPLPLSDLTFWSSTLSAYVEISIITMDELYPQTLITGMADTVLANPIQGTVAIEGRDLSSLMIDAYRQCDFVNQTASEVASTLALYHGLTPIVTSTQDNVGRYYGDGYTRLSLGQFSRLRSDWDVIVQLARENAFDVFVQGKYLFFQPSTWPGPLPLRVALRDIKTIRFERNLAVSPDITARVQSWNSQNMMPYYSNSPGLGAGVPQASAATDGQPFLFAASNYTPQQVTDMAGRYAAELKRMGVVMHIEMPWDLTLSPRTAILVDETNSLFDAVYQIDSIERHYSATHGSTQTIRAVIV